VALGAHKGCVYKLCIYKASSTLLLSAMVSSVAVTITSTIFITFPASDMNPSFSSWLAAMSLRQAILIHIF